MKKVTDFIKPNILIVFGALMLLYYMNWLQDQGAGLAIGIVAMILSAYYLTIGILQVLMGDKLSNSLKKVFEMLSVCLFAVFMFVFFLLSTIECAKIDGFMGPTAWIIAILSMIASLALAAIYAVAKFGKAPIMQRLAYLFSAIFALVLLLNIIFDGAGNPRILGNINVLLVCLYGVFVFYSFSAIGKAEDSPKQVEEQPANEEEDLPQEENNI